MPIYFYFVLWYVVASIQLEFLGFLSIEEANFHKLIAADIVNNLTKFLSLNPSADIFFMGSRKRKAKSEVTPPPQKKFTSIQNAGQAPSRVIITPMSNRYEILGEDSNEVVVNKPKKERVPPITISGMSREQLLQFLGAQQLTDYTIKPLKHGIHPYFTSTESHQKARDALKEKKVGFYSHDLPKDKFYKVVLSGLHKIDLQELRQELKTLNVDPADIKIIQPRSPR